MSISNVQDMSQYFMNLQMTILKSSNSRLHYILKTIDSRDIETTRRSFTENVLSSGGSNDDLRTHWRYPNFNAWVAVLSKLSREHLVELSEEHTISYELRS